MMKYVLCAAAGGVGLGYLLTRSQFQRQYYNGYNAGFEEAKEYYKNCEGCVSGEGEKQEMSDEEFASSPEVLEAATRAAEALEDYQGIGIEPTVLASEMTKTVARAVERGELESEVEVLDSLTDPAIRNKLLEKAGEIKTATTNYNAISTSPKTEKKVIEQKNEEKPEEPSPSDVEIEEITDKAFIGNEFNYKQFSFTYYAGDGVLMNEQDEPVSTEAMLYSLGPDICKRLLAGPEAMDITKPIYVRNRTAEWEFEVEYQPIRSEDLLG